MLTWAIANLSGFVLLICVAYVCGFFKGQPWKKRANTAPVQNAKMPETKPGLTNQAQFLQVPLIDAASRVTWRGLAGCLLEKCP